MTITWATHPHAVMPEALPTRSADSLFISLLWTSIADSVVLVPDSFSLCLVAHVLVSLSPFPAHPSQSRALGEVVPHATEDAATARLLVSPTGLAICHGLVLAVTLVAADTSKFVGAGG